jgi:hypothetical protein
MVGSFAGGFADNGDHPGITAGAGSDSVTGGMVKRVQVNATHRHFIPAGPSVTRGHNTRGPGGRIIGDFQASGDFPACSVTHFNLLS